MFRLGIVVASLLACLCAQEQPGRFNVEVKLVTVLATVKNSQGVPTGELEREDFTLFAAGVPQRIAIF